MRLQRSAPSTASLRTQDADSSVLPRSCEHPRPVCLQGKEWNWMSGTACDASELGVVSITCESHCHPSDRVALTPNCINKIAQIRHGPLVNGITNIDSFDEGRGTIHVPEYSVHRAPGRVGRRFIWDEISVRFVPGDADSPGTASDRAGHRTCFARSPELTRRGPTRRGRAGIEVSSPNRIGLVFLLAINDIQILAQIDNDSG